MENWGQKFGLYFRNQIPEPGAHALIQMKILLPLTQHTVIHTKAMRHLSRWDRQKVFVAAHAMELKEGCVSGISACLLWGIAVDADVAPVEITLPGNNKGPSKKQWVENKKYSNTFLHPDDIKTIHGMRVVSIPKALAHIARDYGELAAIVSIDSARNQYPQLTKEYLRTWVKNRPPFHGKTAFLTAIEKSSHLCESPPETRARLIVEQMPEIRSMELQAQIKRFRVDMLIDGWLVVEIDGDLKYLEDPEEAIVKERKREKEIQNQGFTVIRVNAADVPDIGKYIRSALYRAA